MTAAKTTRKPKGNASPNGQPDPLAEAIVYEQAIAAEAEAIWAEDTDKLDIDPLLFRRLRPLLRRPIPPGFIEHVGEVSGKPYSSDGIRSVQVQMDRLDNVLHPENWGYVAEHSEDGKRCYVTAHVGADSSNPLFERDSWGGVNRGSTEGNLWKGSFTNAAKLALARLGPGWEVYVGAADFDPDTDQAAAKAQEGTDKPEAVKTISAEQVAELRDRFDALPGEPKHNADELKLLLGGELGVSARSVNTALAKLTPTQATVVDGWLADAEKAGEKS